MCFNYASDRVKIRFQSFGKNGRSLVSRFNRTLNHKRNLLIKVAKVFVAPKIRRKTYRAYLCPSCLQAVLRGTCTAVPVIPRNIISPLEYDWGVRMQCSYVDFVICRNRRNLDLNFSRFWQNLSSELEPSYFSSDSGNCIFC